MVLNKNKHVLFVDHDPKITGSTVSMKYLIEGFGKNGFDISLLTPKDVKYYEYFSESKMNFIHWKYKLSLDLYYTPFENISLSGSLKSALRLTYKLFMGCFLAFIHVRKIKPDLIYINEYVLAQFSIVGKILRIPVVCHIRSPFVKGKYGIRRYLISNLLKTFCDYVFAITMSEADQILDNINNRKNNIHVVKEFLDEKNFHNYEDLSSLKKAFSLPLDKKIILMAGGIEPIKGSINMVEAFAKVVQQFGNIFLVIAGPINENYEYNKKFYKVIEKNNLYEVIKIIGFTDKMNLLIACCDILVSSSTTSHFSRPVIEAWAQKKIIISSDTLHAREIIKNNINGFLYKTGDSDSLAKKITEVLSGNHDLVKISNEAYKSMEENYSAEKNVNEIVNNCLKIL